VSSGISAPVRAQALVVWWQSRHVPHQPSQCTCTQGGVCGSIESLVGQIALRTALSRSTLFRRLQSGTLTMDEADRFACALGTTPYVIWPGFDRAPVTAALTRSGPVGSGTLF
jgi:hypothetical protein